MEKVIKFFYIFFIAIMLFNCSQESENNNSSGSGVDKNATLAMQMEMLEILENNTNNPKQALKELDKYYEKYSKVLKKQLDMAKSGKNKTTDEYIASMSEKEKELLERQQKAIKKILKKEPNFNMKLMLLMKKHGLASDN